MVSLAVITMLGPQTKRAACSYNSNPMNQVIIFRQGKYRFGLQYCGKNTITTLDIQIKYEEITELEMTYQSRTYAGRQAGRQAGRLL